LTCLGSSLKIPGNPALVRESHENQEIPASFLSGFFRSSPWGLLPDRPLPARGGGRQGGEAGRRARGAGAEGGRPGAQARQAGQAGQAPAQARVLRQASCGGDHHESRDLRDHLGRREGPQDGEELPHLLPGGLLRGHGLPQDPSGLRRPGRRQGPGGQGDPPRQAAHPSARAQRGGQRPHPCPGGRGHGPYPRPRLGHLPVLRGPEEEVWTRSATPSSARSPRGWM